MKSFLKYTLLFLMPLAIAYSAVEYYFRTNENSFRIKAAYLTQNLDSIEVLILGSSRSQNAINPAFLSLNTANIANGSQDLRTDSALFFHFAKRLKSLKHVVLELDYHRMDMENDKSFYRIPWYYIFYGVEVLPIHPTHKISLYATNPSFFNENIKKLLFNHSKTVQTINKYGFVEKNYTNQFLSDFNYDSLKIDQTASERLQSRHREVSPEVFSQNIKIVNAVIDYCLQHHIEPIIINTPLYYTYRDRKMKGKDEKRLQFIQTLQDKGAQFYNFEEAENFDLHSFSNDDHLNYDGAKVFTLMLDSILVRK